MRDEGKLVLSSTKRNFLLSSLPLLLIHQPIHTLPLDFYQFSSSTTATTTTVFLLFSFKQWTLSFSQTTKKQNIHQSKTSLTTYKQHITLLVHFVHEVDTRGDDNTGVNVFMPFSMAFLPNKYSSVHLVLLFFYLMFIFKSLSFCWAEWSLSSVCWTSFPMTCVLDRKASTSLRSRISGFNPVSLVSVTSFEKTFKIPKIELTW